MNSDYRMVYLLVLLCLILCRTTYSQVQNDDLIEQILESMAPSLSEDHDYSEILEHLSNYRRSPLNINLASKEQLQELFFISPVQVKSILSHREENGLFIDVLELQSVPGFDLQTLRWLLNFIVVLPPGELKSVSFKKLIMKAEHDLMMRFGRVLEKQSGFSSSSLSESNYAGSAMRMFTRYRYNFSNVLFASVNMEKDAGEPLSFSKGGRGFDFYSANISFRGNGIVRKVIAGDYALQFGQGLSMWAGAGFGKGANLSTIAKHDVGLRPYSSVNESLFMRGIAGTFKLKAISFTPFYSGRRIDAGITESGLEISSIQVNGLHRTKTEILNKNAISQRVYGANFQYNSGDLSAGITAYRTQFSIPFAEGKSLYQKYNFKGAILTNASMNYSYTFRNSYFFGETAHSLNSGFAFLNGLLSGLAPPVSLVLLYRNYERNYHSFFNQGLAEASNAVNERGFYSGLAIKFNRQWELYTYSDFFRFPWLKFRVDSPSSGYELFGQIIYTPGKLFKLIGRFRQQIKEENTEDSGPGLDIVDKQNLRVEMTYKLSNDFSIRNRAEIVRYREGTQNPELGFLSSQDIIYDPIGSKISGNFRFAIFETSGFNTRIYSYENDVLYSYSVPAYQGKGVRFYINGRYTISRGTDLWLRYALISYANQEVIGSGGDQINGNKRSDIKVQLRFQF
ncbi:MAG TPA: helix-hairpin-helix domain-containing protein [Daejeonella sp.]|uniref:ComEA family DNA-binding protein n=1 Tax=Daejeonella sp. TaxID=2805397 RepID=UPI002EDAA203